jgi:hypothetical protein
MGSHRIIPKFREFSGITIVLKAVRIIRASSNNVNLVKSRHTGENRCPGILQLFDISGFRLSPE